MKKGRKRFMNNCYKCDVKLKEKIQIRKGVDIYFLQCPKCGEEFYTSDELTRHEQIVAALQHLTNPKNMRNLFK